MSASPLDPFIPVPDVRERFSVPVDAPAATTMAVARAFDMQSVWLVKAIFSARERLTGSTRQPRRPQGFVEELVGLGWGLLRDEPDRLLVGGAICQPWLADVRFRAVPKAAFLEHTEPDHVKIAWTLEVEPEGPTRCRLTSETRAVGTDVAARSRFLRYWRWARFGIVAIRWLLLPAIAREARRRARAVPATR